MIGRVGYLALVLGLLLVTSRLSTAQNRPAPNEAAPLVYRRIFVPESELQSQARGLLPMKRAEFEKRIDAATRTSREIGPNRCRIDSASYRAEFRDGQLISGSATFDVRCPAGSAGSVPLGNTNIAISSSQWDESPPRSALLGRDDSGNIILQAEGSSQLLVEWSARGRQAEGGGWFFDLTLPSATRSELQLAIPADWVLTSDSCIVSRLPDTRPEDEPTAEAISATGESTWLLELGGASRARFSVDPPSIDSDDPVFLVSESSDYRFAPGSLDADLSLNLDIPERPISEVALRVEPPLSVLSVRYGDERLTWQEGAPDEFGIRRFTVELPEALAVGSHALQVTATAQWEPDDERTLPRVHIEGGIWQTGSATLSATGDVRLNARAVQGAQQTVSTLPTGASESDPIKFDFFSDDAKISVLASRPKARLQVQSGLSIVVDATQATATLIADLTIPAGPASDKRFDISAAASRRWVIESVETVPADLLEERTLTARSADSQRLAIRLRHPLTNHTAARLIVRARRQRTRDEDSLSSDFLRLLTFDDVESQRRLISIASTDPTIEPALISDAQIDRRDPATASPYERTLFESRPGPMLVELNSPENAGRLTLRKGDPRFTAEIENIVRVSRGSLSHEVRIILTPESSSLSKVLVRSSPDARGAMQWSVESEDSQVAAIRQLPGFVNTENGESLQQLQLQGPHSGPVTLIGRSSQPYDRTCDVTLFSFPEATSQAGTVQVTSSDGTSLQLRSDGEIFAIPLPPSEPGKTGPILGRFRYEPGRRANLTLMNQTPFRRPTQKLFVRKRSLRSTFSSDGSASHVDEFQLDNLATSRFVLKFPPGCTLQGATIDGNSAAVVRQSQGDGSLVVPLPMNARRPVIELRYNSPSSQQSAGLKTQFRAPLPQLTVPCLESEWVVRLAPGVRSWSVDSTAVREESTVLPRPFNPFSMTQWRALVDRFAGAERVSQTAVGEALLGNGWSEHRLSLPESQQASIAVYRPAVVTVIGIALALLVFAFTSGLAQRTGNVILAGLSCLSFLMVCFSPVPLTPIAWWVLSGVAASVIWRGLKVFAGPASADPNHRRISWFNPLAFRRARFSGSCLLLGSTLVLINPLHAEQEPAKDAEEVEEYRVVIPVDEKQSPSGDYVYLSEELYESLHRIEERRHKSDLPWLITSAAYEIAITEDESGVQPLGCDITADFEVHTFKDGATVSLPLGRGDLHLVEPGSTLNDQPLVSSWNESRDVLTIQVPERGRHLLRFRFGVAFQRHDDRYLADVVVPRIPKSKARLHFNAARGEGEIPVALGVRDSVAEDGILEADLGPISHLQVRYRPLGPETRSPTAVSVDQRIWWKVRPGSVLAEGRFEFASTGGELRQITLRTDPRVKLLPLESDTGIARQWVEQGTANITHIELAPPYPTEASLHAKFLFVGATGSGNLVPPAIDAVAESKARDWQAVSVTPGWRVEGIDDGLSPGQFARSWGGGPGDPELAWDRAALSGSPTLSIRPAESLPVAKEQLDFSLGREFGRAFYRAEIEEMGTPSLQYSVQTSPELRVRGVSVKNDNGISQARWWRASDGLLTFRLETPESPSEIGIEADWALLSQKNSFALPFLRLKGVRASDCEVRVFRQSNVSIQWERNTGFAPADSSLLGGYVNGLGRLHGQFDAKEDSTKTELRVRIEPNAPVVSGQVITAVQPVKDSWKAELHCDLRVRNGAIDVLRFELPDFWSGPFEIEPAVEHSLMSVPGQSRKQLLIRPQLAITDEKKLVIRGPLNGATRDSVRAPVVELLEAPSVARYVALANDDKQELSWETSGLQAARMQESDWPSALSSQRFDLFQVVGGRFEAVARRTAGSGEVARPSVHLADIFFSWSQHRRYFGTAKFHLNPQGLDDCILSIPPDCQVASITLDGAAADVISLNARAVRISLGRRQLPARLDVEFLGRLPTDSTSGGTVQLPSPQLDGLLVEHTLWTITPPKEVESARPVDQRLLTNLARQDVQRLMSSLEALQSATKTTNVRLAASDLRDWRLKWNRHFDRDMVRLEQRKVTGGVDEAWLSEQIRSLQLQRATLVDESEMVSADPELIPADSDVTSDAPVVYLTHAGKMPFMHMHLREAATRTSAARQRTAAIWCVIVLALFAAVFRFHSVRDWVRTSPWLIVAMVGICSCLIFPESPLGWVVAVAGGLLAAFPRWTGLAYPYGRAI